MTTALEGGEWSAARPGHTLPLGKPRYPFYRRLGGLQGQSEQAENLVPTRIISQTIQPIVSHMCVYMYTYIYIYITCWSDNIVFENKIVFSALTFADWALFSCPTPTWEFAPFKYHGPTLCITQSCPRIKLDFQTPGWNTVTAYLEYKSTSSLGKSGNIVTLNPLSAGCPIYYTLVLLHIMTSGW